MALVLIHRFRMRICIVLLLSTLLLSWSMPAQASALNPSLEEQVLQIIHEHPEIILESVESYRQKQQEQNRQVQLELLQAFKVTTQA